MTTKPQSLLANAPFPGTALAALRRTAREFATHDWFVFLYVMALNVAVLNGAPGPARTAVMQQSFVLTGIFITSLVAIRSGLLRDAFFAPLLYRIAIYGSVQFSYFMLRDLLPVASPGSVDTELYRIDLLLFGFEPAMKLDEFVTPETTEWFAYFYFGYFFLLAVHVLSILLFVKERQLQGEFCFGMLTVFCIGHIVYMLVPGYGPYRAMADHFQNVLPHGMWVDQVLATVASGGAQKDIFPSIHTAAPMFIALLSFRHRHAFPFKYTWWFVFGVALNIVVATMFLRWHYIIDVVAGLALSGLALLCAQVFTRLELSRRDSLGLSDSWPDFFPAKRGT